MKKRLLIGKFIGFIGIIIFAMGVSYIITYYADSKKYQDINLLVTYEDTKTFKVDNITDKETILKTYPYKFEVKNNNKANISYNICIKKFDKLENKNSLSYILYKNDEVVKTSKINDKCLYKDKISGKESINYSLYVYGNETEYSLEILYK